MWDNAYIVWLEVIPDGGRCRQALKPGRKPEAEFEIGAKKVTAREYCSVHGLWKSG